MDKLLLQLAAGGIVVLLGRGLDCPWWVTAGAVVVGWTITHLIYERFRSGSTRHLGAAAISNDDPLMLSAFDEARRTWPRFLELFAGHPKDSLVKFRLRTKAGDIENVWGDLLELGPSVATVYLRTPPVGETELLGRRLEIPVADIVDWQVMVADGTLRGGFTQQATFRIIEREDGALPRKLVEQLGRYRPVAD
jgi:uncharacterized protein YegJ (DUF2314 family)